MSGKESRDRVNALVNTQLRKEKKELQGNGESVVCLHDCVSALSRKYGYSMSVFVEEMIVAGLLSSKNISDDFLGLIGGGRDCGNPQLSLLVEKVKGILKA